MHSLSGRTGRWGPGISTDACSRPGCWSKSCDLLPAFTPCNTWSSGGTGDTVGWRVKASQLDLTSLTPLSVAGCGRLQLGAPIPHSVVVGSPLEGSWPYKALSFSFISVSKIHFYHWILQDSNLFTGAWSVESLFTTPPPFYILTHELFGALQINNKLYHHLNDE